MKKVENGMTTYYLRSSMLGGQVVAEIVNGVWYRGYVYLGGQLLAVQWNGSANWVHQDPVAKSKRVTNGAGNILSTVELDPWGGNTNRSGNVGYQPRTFTSYERDVNVVSLSSVHSCCGPMKSVLPRGCGWVVRLRSRIVEPTRYRDLVKNSTSHSPQHLC